MGGGTLRRCQVQAEVGLGRYDIKSCRETGRTCIRGGKKLSDEEEAIGDESRVAAFSEELATGILLVTAINYHMGK